MLTSAVGLSGLDSLVRTLGIAPRRRITFLLAATVAIWPVLAMWMHPEDVMAVGLLAFGLSCSVRGRWAQAGWLIGAAITMQLYVILAVPVVIAYVGRRRVLPMLARLSLLPGCLAAAVLVPDFQDSWKALTQQRSFPLLNHPTPWILLAPHLPDHTVGGGTARVVGMAVALACGVAAVRFARDPATFVWITAIALSARCLFEAVVVPYYVMPLLTIALAIGCRTSARRWFLVLVLGVLLTVTTYFYAPIWRYWLQMAVLAGLLLWASNPGTHRRRSPLFQDASPSTEENATERCSGVEAGLSREFHGAVPRNASEVAQQLGGEAVH